VTAALGRAAPGAAVGLFGLLGQGNLGNDASMEAVLAWLRSEYPCALVDALCTGPEQLTARYGLPATQLRWYTSRRERPKPAAIPLKIAGKIIDARRIISWVRKHDIVIVPGMGVLEATNLPQGPFQTPYSMFLLSAVGWLSGTTVALVSVGASVPSSPLTRWFLTSAARLARYRSYRDEPSKEALRQMGVDTSSDRVYPDLVFSLPVPDHGSVIANCVGVGVMDYSGSNDDRKQGDAIRAAYAANMTAIVLWLLDKGRTVLLFTGDVHDDAIVQRIVDDVKSVRPALRPSVLTISPASSIQELMRNMATAEFVIATRYHNVLCGLKLGKPTISIGYGEKFDALMAQMGLADFCHSAKAVDLSRLMSQIELLEGQGARIADALAERGAANERLLAQQFDELSDLFRLPPPRRRLGARARRLSSDRIAASPPIRYHGPQLGAPVDDACPGRRRPT